MGSIPGLGRVPRGGHSNPLQYSCLENPKVRGAWQVAMGSQSWKWLRRLSRAWDNHAALAKTSIKSHTNHFFAVMGTIKIQSLKNSELYNTWLSIITTLCMRSPGIIDLIASRYQNWHLNEHLDDSHEASVLAKRTREGRYWLGDRIASSFILWARKGYFPKRTALSWVFLMRRAVSLRDSPSGVEVHTREQLLHFQECCKPVGFRLVAWNQSEHPSYPHLYEGNWQNYNFVPSCFLLLGEQLSSTEVAHP